MTLKMPALICYLCETIIARVSLEKGLGKECRRIVGQEKGVVMKYVVVECSGWDGQPLPLQDHGWQAMVEKTWKWRRLIAETKKSVRHASKNLYTSSRVRCSVE